MIRAEVDLVRKRVMRVARRLEGEVEGGGDNASTSWPVFGGTNLRRPPLTSGDGSERQKVHSGDVVVDGSDGMAGRETRNGSTAGGGGEENRKDRSGGGELYVTLGKPRDRDHFRPEAWG
jgi:hypothetical protein